MGLVSFLLIFTSAALASDNQCFVRTTKYVSNRGDLVPMPHVQKYEVSLFGDLRLGGAKSDIERDPLTRCCKNAEKDMCAKKSDSSPNPRISCGSSSTSFGAEYTVQCPQMCNVGWKVNGATSGGIESKSGTYYAQRPGGNGSCCMEAQKNFCLTPGARGRGFEFTCGDDKTKWQANCGNEPKLVSCPVVFCGVPGEPVENVNAYYCSNADSIPSAGGGVGSAK